MKLGRNRPVFRGPRLHLRNYLTPDIPPPPPSIDYSPSASAALSQVYDNDVLGDCVIAAMAHIEGVITGNGNPPPFIYTSDQIIALYSAIGGYVPGDPSTDQGCDEQTALKYWQSKGAPAGSHQIAGWVAIDAGNVAEYQTALWLFENLFFGVELPDEWINPYPSASGFTWNVAGAPNPNNGHAFVGTGYGVSGVTICTWGMEGLLTSAAIAKYVAKSAGGEMYAVLSQDAINKASQKAPNGFNYQQLMADLSAITEVQPPSPPVPTPPGPPPSPPAPPQVMSKDELFYLITQAAAADLHNLQMTPEEMAVDIASICKEVTG